MDRIHAVLAPLLLVALLPQLLATAASARDADKPQRRQAPSQKSLDFYRSQSPITDPGIHSTMYAGISDDIAGAVAGVQGVVLHGAWLWSYGLTLSDTMPRTFAIRRVEEMLAKIETQDPRPLSTPRAPADRTCGNCRTFAVLLCSILRYHGIPARVRCGYATYFTPEKYENHWICEYWKPQQMRWVQVDAQLDHNTLRALHISFDPLDLPAGKFITAGQAWLLCRSGKLDPNLCGNDGPKGWETEGWEYVAEDVVRDFWARNKFEVIVNDRNEFLNEKVIGSESYRSFVDHLSKLESAGDADPETERQWMQSHKELAIPAAWIQTTINDD